MFFLDSLTRGAYTEQDVALVDPVAQQLALAIDNTRLFQDIEEKGRQLEIANKHKSQFLANMSHELQDAAQRHSRLHGAHPRQHLRRGARKDPERLCVWKRMAAICSD